ncbi:hypothetical protein BDZ97DRAFT_1914814 [Flammula alnicola]|nr:hypothetical protein BDZ97DRAFT_1914814 [Flammula alnicola]
MFLRSSAKKQKPTQAQDTLHVGNGVYVHTTPSATDDGLRVRWQPVQEPDSPTPANMDEQMSEQTQTDDLPLADNDSNASFSSVFDGSLSSLSSSDGGSSSGGSFSSVVDTPMSSVPSQGSGLSRAPSYQDLLDFVAPKDVKPDYHLATPVTPQRSAGPSRVAHGTPLRRSQPYPPRNPASPMKVTPRTPSRPLQRTHAQQWIMEDGGALVDIADDPSASTPPIGPTTSLNAFEPNRVFEKEMAALLKQHQNIHVNLQAMENTEQEDVDLEQDTSFMFRGGRAVAPGQVAKQGMPRPIGPHGTEIIDESFRAGPGELGVYPRQWIAHQSTTLKSHPTEQQLDTIMEL